MRSSRGTRKSRRLGQKIATVYPGLERYILKPRDAKVVVDGNIITSKSPGTAILFSLKLVEIILNTSKTADFSRRMRYDVFEITSFTNPRL